MSAGRGAKKQITIVAVGECAREGGPGGYGAVLTYRRHRRELTGGFAGTTARRVGLLAVIAALDILNEPCEIELFTNADPAGASASEPDLLHRLTELRGKHGQIVLRHLTTPQAHPDGPACLALARGAGATPDLPADAAYARRATDADARRHDERRRDEQRREQVSESRLSGDAKALLAQIRELTTIVASKEEQLSTHTMNDRAHDRIYETLQRDQERLATLRQALAEMRRGG